MHDEIGYRKTWKTQKTAIQKLYEFLKFSHAWFNFTLVQSHLALVKTCHA